MLLGKLPFLLLIHSLVKPLYLLYENLLIYLSLELQPSAGPEVVSLSV